MLMFMLGAPSNEVDGVMEPAELADSIGCDDENDDDVEVDEVAEAKKGADEDECELKERC